MSFAYANAIRYCIAFSYNKILNDFPSTYDKWISWHCHFKIKRKRTLPKVLFNKAVWQQGKGGGGNMAELSKENMNSIFETVLGVIYMKTDDPRNWTKSKRKQNSKAIWTCKIASWCLMSEFLRSYGQLQENENYMNEYIYICKYKGTVRREN